MIPFDLTLSLLQKSPDPVGDILRSSAYWIPLQMLYVELVRNKDLTPLSDLTYDEKEKYWNMTEGEQWKRISLCQALYTYESLNKL